jgi:hypothetical protein
MAFSRAAAERERVTAVWVMAFAFVLPLI